MRGKAEERSHYLPWILKDLEPWKENGIDKVSGQQRFA